MGTTPDSTTPDCSTSATASAPGSTSVPGGTAAGSVSPVGVSGSCVFCDRVLSGVEGRPFWADTGLVVAFDDAFGSAAGHTLVVPRRHVARLAGLTAVEHAELWETVRAQVERLDVTLTPDSFTIGVNDGAAAGQSVAHVHVHVIPRWVGDTANPAFGVRWALPETADYTAASYTAPTHPEHR